MHWRFYKVKITYLDRNSEKTDTINWPKIVKDENELSPLDEDDIKSFYENFGQQIFKTLKNVEISENFTTNLNLHF